jgi:signal transduction histidine kinase
MRLFHKIALLLVGMATVPLVTAGFVSVRLGERAVEGEVKARFDEVAHTAAEAVAHEVEGRALQYAGLASLFAWERLQPEMLAAALVLVRRQVRAAAALFVPDGHDPAAGASGLASDAIPGLDAAALLQVAPVAKARKEGPGKVVFAAPERVSGQAELGMAVAGALKVPGGVVLIWLPLAGATARLLALRGGDEALRLFLVDDRARTVAMAAGPGAAPAEVVQEAARAGGPGEARRLVPRQGPALLAAWAPVGSLGWWVIVEKDADRALTSPRRMRTLTLLLLCSAASFAVALAFSFARRLTGALERVAATARALGEGDLEARVGPIAGAGGVEVAALGHTLDEMAGRLAQSRREIEGWNQELEARVEARTAELKATQAQLVQAQKLAALGQLGAGVAHEINNPLGGVIGHVQLLLAGKDAAHPDHEALRCIDEAARRAAEVVQNLLRFSVQREAPVRTTVDLNRLVKETLSLTETLLAEQAITLAVEAASPPPRAHADRGQIAQVLLNLVANARTAMKDGGGRLTITTGRTGDEVMLRVADTGKGILPEHLPRLFEPFFTTKDEWSNVGLGLSVSYRIVSEHDGRIEVESAPGGGATFTVYLPAV